MPVMGAATARAPVSGAGFLTGKYGTQVGITDYITPLEAGAGVGLPSATTAWPEVLSGNDFASFAASR